MARKRKKRRAINWGPAIAALLILNVAIGLTFSTVTGVRKLRIINAQPHDKKRLQALAQTLVGTPYSRVDVNQFESQVLSGRDIYTADLSHNLFGLAVLRLQYRRPVAQVINSPQTFLDTQGVLYSTPETFAYMRRLSLEPEYSQAVLSFAQAWPSQAVADLCIKLDSFDQLKSAVVYMNRSGRLRLLRENSGEVDLGGVEALDEKLRKLRQLLDERPDLLDSVKRLSLADPARPAAVPRSRSAS